METRIRTGLRRETSNRSTGHHSYRGRWFAKPNTWYQPTMHEIIDLDRAGLRKFGLTTGAIVVGLFGLLLPWMFSASLPLWPWYIALALWLPALAYPMVLKPVYKGWMKFGSALGFINTRIILGLFFYTILVPMGLVMRLLGKDPMRRKHSDASSYRIASTVNPPKKMENPF